MLWIISINTEILWQICIFCNKLGFCMLQKSAQTILQKMPIHSWSYGPRSEDYDLISQTTYVVRVLFLYVIWEIYSLTSTPMTNFCKTYHDNFFYLFLQFLLQLCWKQVTSEIFFLFSFFWHICLKLEP